MNILKENGSIQTDTNEKRGHTYKCLNFDKELFLLLVFPSAFPHSIVCPS